MRLASATPACCALPGRRRRLIGESASYQAACLPGGLPTCPPVQPSVANPPTNSMHALSCGCGCLPTVSALRFLAGPPAGAVPSVFTEPSGPPHGIQAHYNHTYCSHGPVRTQPPLGCWDNHVFLLGLLALLCPSAPQHYPFSALIQLSEKIRPNFQCPVRNLPPASW